MIDIRPRAAILEHRRSKEGHYGIWSTAVGGAPADRADAGAIRRGAVRVAAGGEQVGERSFP